ncbi:MAG: hypothetical protein KIS92_15515 [Planctomycetota bacterium]|nr:hypothetical protein [Planctomycetota bacterium]
MYNILIGIFFIIGGVSGSMVVRGTDSSIGLAVLGLALVVWGIFQVSSSGKPARPVRRKTTVSRVSSPAGRPSAPSRKTTLRRPQ